ncbi:MAG: VOC family protein [Chloroflexi bacterium]|nr:VOC family protein [Chloroflexota bacterium]
MSWRITDISYVSVAVNNLETAVADFKRLYGLEEVSSVSVSRPYGWLRIVMGNGAECFQEILQPTNETLPLARFVRDKGEGIYVTSFVVDNLEECARELRAKGVRFATGPEGARPERVSAVWIHPRATTGVYVELTEHLLQRGAPAAGAAGSAPLLKELSYLAVVVRDLKAATKLYQDMLHLDLIRDGLKDEEFGYEATQIGIGDRMLMEIQHPYDESKPMGRFLKNRGEAPYFASFVVDDPKQAVETIQSRGGTALLTGSGIGWIHPKSYHGQMVELIPRHLGR